MNKQVWSECCLSSVRVYSGKEGTNHYICNACNEACDVTDRQTSAQSNKGDTNDIDEILNTLRALAEPNGLITSDIEWAKDKLEQKIAQETNKARIEEIKWALSRTSMDELKERYSELTADKEANT